jgi:hypothetical protein
VLDEHRLREQLDGVALFVDDLAALGNYIRYRCNGTDPVLRDRRCPTATRRPFGRRPSS